MSDENQVVEPAATLDNVAAPETDTLKVEDAVVEAVAKTFTQDELNAIVQKEKAKAEARAERRITRSMQESAERQAPIVSTDKAPSRESFASDEAWLDARDNYRDAKRSEQQRQERSNAEQANLSKKSESIYAQAEKIAGFDREAFDELPITPSIASALIDSDIAPQLMDYLSKHPGEVDRISDLSPARQAAEMGKLEVKLSATPKKQSSAPEPIIPIGGGSKGVTDVAKLSMDDYLAARQKQGARWAR